MGLAEIQQTLARLYTESELRERFFSDPLTVGRELGLSAEEARNLAQLSVAQVRGYADSLVGKRLTGVGKLLPLTRRVLGERFDRHFRNYAAANRHIGAPFYFEDATAFASHLEGKLREERVAGGWVLDLLHFEVARVRAADPSRRVVTRFFRHDIRRLVGSIARREETPDAVRRPSVAVWWRPRKRGPVRYAIFTTPRLFKRRR